MASHIRGPGLLTFVCIAALGCGGGEPPTETRTAPLAASLQTSEAARATYYAAEVARYREMARQQRELSAAYARWTPPATATKNWNATLKTSADARAASADQIAAGLQRVADFHTAEAAKEATR